MTLVTEEVTTTTVTETVTKPRLSEAIRLGGLTHRQAFGDWQPKTGGACAMGAAMYAVGIKINYSTNDDTDDASIAIKNANRVLSQRLDGGLGRGRRLCPVYKVEGDSINCDLDSHVWTNSDMVMHLNDAHNWTFNEIANYLESIGR